MHIRIATSHDLDGVSGVHLSAFSEGERESVSKLAVNLLYEETTPQTISLVAETGNAVVGHIAFSPLKIENSQNIQGYILAPLGVRPPYQKRRVGSKLIETGMQRLLKMGVHVLFVYGDPQYYSRFGFNADAASLYIPPYKIQYPSGWQAIILNEHDVAKLPAKIVCVNSLCDAELW